MKFILWAIMTLAPAAAFGGTININLVVNLELGPPGSTLTFTGSLVNTTGIKQYLNDAQISGLTPSFIGDVTPFFNNAPLFLTANQSTSNIDLYTIQLPAVAPGAYFGVFSIFGGPGSNDQTLFGSSTFEVDVQTVPEPGTLALLMTGAVALLLARRFVSQRV